jgi:hypothetical protein
VPPPKFNVAIIKVRHFIYLDGVGALGTITKARRF